MQKPVGKGYVENPTTLGQQLRNRRLGLQLSVRKAAIRIGVTKEAYTKWEYDQGIPDAQRGAKVIAFLGYNPFQFDTGTLAGKLKAYRYAHGWSQEQTGKALGVDKATILNIEGGKPLLKSTIHKLDELLLDF